MSRRYQVTLHGSGFFVPCEGLSPARGFITIRRVLADCPEDAERKAVSKLELEERYRGLLETTENELGSLASCRVRLESIGELSWFRWFFSRMPQSFIFYQDDKVDT